MEIKIRNIDPVAFKKFDEMAKKNEISSRIFKISAWKNCVWKWNKWKRNAFRMSYFKKYNCHWANVKKGQSVGKSVERFNGRINNNI